MGRGAAFALGCAVWSGGACPHGGAWRRCAPGGDAGAVSHAARVPGPGALASCGRPWHWAHRSAGACVRCGAPAARRRDCGRDSSGRRHASPVCSPVRGLGRGGGGRGPGGGTVGRGGRGAHALFLCVIPCRGLGDPVTAWCARKRRDDEGGGADQACRHGGSGWHGDARLHAGGVKATAKRAEGLGQDTVGVSRLALGLAEATGRHDGTVGAHARAHLCIGGPQCMLEQLQSAQDAERKGLSAPRGLFRTPCGDTVLDGADQRRPGERLRPRTHGRGLRHTVNHWPGCARTTHPMLKRAAKGPGGLSACTGRREPEDTMRGATPQVPMGAREKLVTTT